MRTVRVSFWAQLASQNLRLKVSLILIVLICFQISCDSLETGTVLHRTLRKLKFRVSEISEIYPARLERYDALFMRDLNRAPTETEVKEIQDFVNTGGNFNSGWGRSSAG